MVCRKGTFSRFERIWMQTSFHGVWILGAIAMFPASPPLAVGYVLLFPVLGVVYGVMHLWVCPRCPHIREHGACLQAPASLTRRIMRANVKGPLSAAERVGFFVAMLGVALVPIYWVAQSALIVPYLALVLMHYLAYPLRFCAKCLNADCPLNRALSTGYRRS